MLKDQLTMAMVHEAFIKYLEVRQPLTSQPTNDEWQKFKSLLLTRMQTESAKKHG